MYAFEGPGKERKRFFQSLEDKWYTALDWIDGKGLPVYKLVDPIDKLMPSLALFLVIVLALFAGFVFFVWGPLMGQLLPGAVGPDTGEKAISFRALSVRVLDKETNAPVSGADVVLDFKGTIRKASADASGIAELQAPDVPELQVKGVKTGYANFEETVKIEGKDSIDIQLSREEQDAIKKTVRLVANGELIQGKELLVKFSCSSGVEAPEPAMTTTGIVEVMQPANCGQLSASVDSSSFDSKQSALLLAGSSIISLTERVVPKGHVIVLVKSDEEEFLDNIQVTAFNEQDISLNRKYSVNGETSFELEIGKYYFTAEDSALHAFVSESSNLVDVNENQTEEITLVLTKNAIGSINVNVVDKATKQAVADASVQLKKKDGQVIESRKSTGQLIEFKVKNDVDYVVSVDHNNYLTASIQASLADNNKTIELEALTAENSGVLEITVIDELQKPVEGARLSLFDADKNLLYVQQEKLTDFNGLARFSGVAKGNYYAFAFKGLSFVTGPTISIIDPRGVKKIGISLDVGSTTVKLKVKDSEGKAVKFAKITVIDVLGSKVKEDLANDKGEKELSLKANREVFFRVEAEGFVAFASKPMQLNKGQSRQLDVVLEPKPAELKLELDGFYSEDGAKLTDTITDGSTIEARFNLRVNKAFDRLNAFIRLGDNENAELESAFIKEVKAAEFNEVSKHSKYSVNNGSVIDLNSVTEGEAKWVKIGFKGLKEGIRQLSVFFKVREGTLTGEKIKLYYRVEGITGFGTTNMVVERQPFDEVLGTNANTTGRQGLYALPNAFILFVGKKADCTKEFCYSSSLLDEQAGLYLLEKPFETQLYGKYKLEVEITNIANKKFSDASLRIKSKEKGVQINSYKIAYSGLSETMPEPTDKFELPAYQLGSFDQGGLIRIELELQTIKSQANNLEFRIVSDKKVVYEKNEGIRVGALDTVTVDFEPKTIVPLVENTVSINAIDSKTGIGVSNAVVVMQKDLSSEMVLGTTNAEGMLSVVLPASNPKSKLFVEARKYGYKSEKVSLPLDEKFIELPPELQFNLNAKTGADDSKKIELNNTSKLGFTISSIAFSALSANYLDVQKMQNYLLRYLQPPKAIPAEETTQIELIASLNENGKALLERQQIKGELQFDFSYAGHSWPFSLPVNASIGLEGDVPEGCFSSDLSSWTAATEGAPAERTGYLRNDCFIQDKEIILKTITGSIKWKSNIRGKFSIEVDGVTTDLEPFREKNLLNNLEPGEHLMKLIYVPEPGMQGEKAEADILLTAVNPSGGGTSDQKLKHTTRASISVDNVSECIKPKTMSLKMNEKESADLEIESSCAGTVEVKIDGPLRPARHSIVFSPGETKTIAITSDDEKGTDPCTEGACPGIYPVKIYAKSTRSKGAFKFIAEVPARIDSISSIKLNRYEFDLFDTQDIESAYISNDKLTDQETVMVKVNAVKEEYDWGKLIVTIVVAAVLFYVLAPMLITTTTTTTTTSALGETLSTITSTAVSSTPSIGFSEALGLGMGTAKLMEPSWHTIPLVHTQPGTYQDNYLVERVNLDDNKNSANMEKGVDAESGSGINVELKESFKEDTGKTYLTQGRRLELTKGQLTGDEKENASVNRFLELKLNNQGYTTYYEWDADESPVIPRSEPPLIYRDAGKDLETTETFHLKFNTKKATEKIETGSDLLAADCIGPNYKIGKTGPSALPRVKFGWNWSDIGWNTCDEGKGQNYCDATQFSIEVLNRVRMLESFIGKNQQNLVCPNDLLMQKLKAKLMESSREVIELNDIAIVNAAVFGRIENNPLQLMALIENKTNKEINIDLKVDLNRIAENGAITKLTDKAKQLSETINASESKMISIELGGMPKGYYVAGLSMTPTLSGCTGCDLDKNNDVAFMPFELLEKTPALVSTECIVDKTTQNINSWIEATQAAGKEINYDISGSGITPDMNASVTGLADLHNLIGFNAYLIKDGYTVDFKKDFDSFAKQQAFFDAPSFYLGSSGNPGLSSLFTSNSFRFTPVYNKDLLFYELPGAGLYHVDLEVNFKGNDWALFEGSEPKADVVVSMEKVQSTDLKSPFYYLPLNGNIGVEGGKVSRQGYGTDYSGDYVSVSKSNLGLNTVLGAKPKDIVSVNVTDSNPVSRLETSVVQDAGSLNQAYGTVMVLEEQQGKMKLRFSPSKPNPVIMRLTNEVGGAYAFYQLLKQDIPVEAGHSLAKWNGIGVNCRDFDGSIATQVFERGDIKGINAQCVSSPSFRDSTVYGMEYCDSSSSGNMFYKTILYTPETQGNFVLKKVAADSVARFYTPNKPTELEQVSLNGLTGFNKKNYDYGENIDSLQEVFDLVDKGMLCVNQNDVKAEFWWNPKYVYEFTVDATGKSVNDLQGELLSSQGCMEVQ